MLTLTGPFARLRAYTVPIRSNLPCASSPLLLDGRAEELVFLLEFCVCLLIDALDLYELAGLA
jgi:hypothetical protein